MVITGRMKKGGREGKGRGRKKMEEKGQTGFVMDEPGPWVVEGSVPRSKAENRWKKPVLSLLSGAMYVVPKYQTGRPAEAYICPWSTNRCLPTVPHKSGQKWIWRKQVNHQDSLKNLNIYLLKCFSCSLFLGQSNTFPRVVNPIELITATTGHRLHFPIPPDTFYDQEDGHSGRLMLAIKSVNVYPSGSESWLQLNATHQVMHGYSWIGLNWIFNIPLRNLFFVPLILGVWLLGCFWLLSFPKYPLPHLLTLVHTKNSVYSFIKKRERIGLFFC